MAGSRDDSDPKGKPRTTAVYGTPVAGASHYPPTITDSLSPLGVSPLDPLVTRYRIGDVIGRGGMGEVLSARDEHIGRSVAVKRLRVPNPPPDVLARFLREARVQARLEHPAVVPVHEVHDEEGSQPYFVMKQLSGTTLADVLPRLAARDPVAEENFTRQRLLRAFTDVCLAIEFAHTRGIVHRDLKPANIQLGEFGEVYVLDWGIARVAGDEPARGRSSFADIDTGGGAETVAGAILGTPGYISPEQIRGDLDLDGRADVYALGCILFEILALQPLHPRGQPALASALTGIDARPSLRAPDREIPPELDHICARATMVDRDQRFASARQLGDAVQRYLDGNRDVSLRKELARAELAAARDAIDRGVDPKQRTHAIRAATRALALDPTNREPADLVGRLMLETPREMPPEVGRELDKLDLDALRSSAHLGMFSAIAIGLLIPLLYLAGFRELWPMIAGGVVCALIVVVDLTLARTRPHLAAYIAMGAYLGLFGLLAWLLSPVIVGPGPGVIMIMLVASQRTVIGNRPWRLSVLLGAAILATWILHALGLVDPTTTVSGSTITLHTRGRDLDPTITLIALGLYIQGTILLAGFLSRLQDEDRRAARSKLQLQSWQLRQLMPKAQTRPPI